MTKREIVPLHRICDTHSLVHKSFFNISFILLGSKFFYLPYCVCYCFVYNVSAVHDKEIAAVFSPSSSMDRLSEQTSSVNDIKSDYIHKKFIARE